MFSVHRLVIRAFEGTINYNFKLKFFERKVYRRILGPVYGNEDEFCRILTNKEIYASVKKPTIIETIRLHRLLELDCFCPIVYM